MEYTRRERGMLSPCGKSSAMGVKRSVENRGEAEVR